jgi:Dienelactone hydrolase family
MAPQEHVKAFEDEVNTARADARVMSYAGAVQGFANQKNGGSIAPGIRYDESADRQS